MREPIGDRLDLSRLYMHVLRAERAGFPLRFQAVEGALAWIAEGGVAVIDEPPARAIGAALADRNHVVVCHLADDAHDLRRVYEFAEANKLSVIFLANAAPQFTDLDSGNAIGIGDALMIGVAHAVEGIPSIIRYSMGGEPQQRRDRPAARCQLALIERRLLPEPMERRYGAEARHPTTHEAHAPCVTERDTAATVTGDEAPFEESAPVGPSSTMDTAVRRARELYSSDAPMDSIEILTVDERLQVLLGATTTGARTALTIDASHLPSLPRAAGVATLIICETDLPHSLPHGLVQAAANGWYIAIPTTPADVLGLAARALRTATPLILVIDPNSANRTWGPLPLDDSWTLPLDRSRICITGSDLTIVAYGTAVADAQSAARRLIEEGVSVTVIDIRTLHPLPLDEVVAAAKATHRALVVVDAKDPLYLGARIAAEISRGAFYELDAPVSVASGDANAITKAAHTIIVK